MNPVLIGTVVRGLFRATIKVGEVANSICDTIAGKRTKPAAVKSDAGKIAALNCCKEQVRKTESDKLFAAQVAARKAKLMAQAAKNGQLENTSSTDSVARVRNLLVAARVSGKHAEAAAHQAEISGLVMDSVRKALANRAKLKDD
jgi:hypothetical protein